LWVLGERETVTDRRVQEKRARDGTFFSWFQVWFSLTKQRFPFVVLCFILLGLSSKFLEFWFQVFDHQRTIHFECVRNILAVIVGHSLAKLSG
jgi:thiosulfate reductase cytochrome b subunit